MPREDYEAISKIVEDVIGKDTLSCIKLLEGIKFYLDNKVETVRIVKTNSVSQFRTSSISEHSKAASIAMEKYSSKLRRVTEKLKASGKYCGVRG